MRYLTIKYTDLALECLCSDLEWELVKFVQGSVDAREDAPRRIADGSSSRKLCGNVLVLECRALVEMNSLEVSARLAGEPEPRYHGVGLEWGLLSAKLAVGSGDPLGLLHEYWSRHGHRPMAPSSQSLQGTSSLAA